MLRRFGITAIATIIIWFLSPLGGQSSLRILRITSTSMDSQYETSYLNTNFSLGQSGSIFSSGDDDSFSLVRSLLQASLLEQYKIHYSSVDQWNCLKIPKLDGLSPFTDAAPDNPWINVSQRTWTVWSSLTGLKNLETMFSPNYTFSTFTLESSYLDLNCSDSTSIEDDFSSVGSYKDSFKSGLQFHDPSSPFTSVSPGIPGNHTSSFFLDLSSPLDPEFKKSPNLLYASNLGNQEPEEGLSLDLFNCTIGIARVESVVTCQWGSCAVNRMRRSEVDTRPTSYVPINEDEYKKHVLVLALCDWYPALWNCFSH